MLVIVALQLAQPVRRINDETAPVLGTRHKAEANRFDTAPHHKPTLTYPFRNRNIAAAARIKVVIAWFRPQRTGTGRTVPALWWVLAMAIAATARNAT
jgi:hypothetical protein